MPIVFKALETETVRQLQSGGPDANGQRPEVGVSEGSGVPCRHCLQNVEKGKRFLTLGHRPFESVHAYAETGPVFLCADACERHAESGELPDVVASSPQFIIRGYTEDERIRYGTGRVVPTVDMISACQNMFEDADIAFIHVRSASNNCFYCRIERCEG